MSFTVRDLMLHVLPENGVDDHAFRLCQTQTGPPPPKPHPGPGPKRPPGQPQCVPITATGEPGVEAAAGVEAQALAMLRAQLQEALRSADGAAQR